MYGYSKQMLCTPLCSLRGHCLPRRPALCACCPPAPCLLPVRPTPAARFIFAHRPPSARPRLALVAQHASGAPSLLRQSVRRRRLVSSVRPASLPRCSARSSLRPPLPVRPPRPSRCTPFPRSPPGAPGSTPCSSRSPPVCSTSHALAVRRARRVVCRRLPARSRVRLAPPHLVPSRPRARRPTQPSRTLRPARSALCSPGNLGGTDWRRRRPMLATRRTALAAARAASHTARMPLCTFGSRCARCLRCCRRHAAARTPPHRAPRAPFGVTSAWHLARLPPHHVSAVYDLRHTRCSGGVGPCACRALLVSGLGSASIRGNAASLDDPLYLHNIQYKFECSGCSEDEDTVLGWCQ
jgi:hypothetical protein